MDNIQAFALLMWLLFFFMLGWWIGSKLGWLDAHNIIAEQCEKLGGFYTNNKIYKCTEIKSSEEEK